MADLDERTKDQRAERRRQALRTPRAAAIAGILFALLFSTSISLMRFAIPEAIGDSEASVWLQNNAETVSFALTLAPFAGIAFLWFMGVVRAHLGDLEDQLFSTVFFGSGLLFLAMIFASAAVADGTISAYALAPTAMEGGGVIAFGRSVIYTITNVYAIRMAGVFMLSLGTIWGRTGAMPRAFVFVTYALAVLLLLVINLSLWVIMIFPLWVLAISIYILVVSMRGKAAEAESAVGGKGSSFSGIGHRFGQGRRFKSAAGSQSALKRTGCPFNPLQRVSHIRRRFQPVAQTMTNVHLAASTAAVR